MGEWQWRSVLRRVRRFVRTVGGTGEPRAATAQPGRKWQGLSYEEAVARWAQRIEIQPQDYGDGEVLELSFEDTTHFTSVKLEVIAKSTGEVVTSHEQWRIEKCSGDVWSRDGQGWRLIMNVYGRPNG